MQLLFLHKRYKGSKADLEQLPKTWKRIYIKVLWAFHCFYFIKYIFFGQFNMNFSLAPKPLTGWCVCVCVCVGSNLHHIPSQQVKGRGERGSISSSLCICLSCPPLFLPFSPFYYSAPWLLLPQEGQQRKSREGRPLKYLALWLVTSHPGHDSKEPWKAGSVTPPSPRCSRNEKTEVQSRYATSLESCCFQGLELRFGPRGLHPPSGRSFPAAHSGVGYIPFPSFMKA